MYYQLRRDSRQNKSPIRISFKRYPKIWRLINASFMKTVNFAISFPIIVLLFLIIPITLVFKWIVSLAHRIVCLGGTYLYNAINFTLLNIYNYNFTTINLERTKRVKYLHVCQNIKFLFYRFYFLLLTYPFYFMLKIFHIHFDDIHIYFKQITLNHDKYLFINKGLKA